MLPSAVICKVCNKETLENEPCLWCKVYDNLDSLALEALIKSLPQPHIQRLHKKTRKKRKYFSK